MIMLNRAARLLILMTGPLACGCQSNSTTPTPTPPALPRASLTMTFDENPVAFRSAGCSFSTPQGWYTSARVQETAGVTFTPTTLTQKLDGNTASVLAESFNSRFGACTGLAFTPAMIPANGAACGIVGICTANTFSTYQFSIAGTDGNGHTLTFDSPMLRFGARPAGQLTPLAAPSVPPTGAPAPIRSWR
jgi:hypothetical protein